MPFLLFVSGSSGAEKTTVLQYLANRLAEEKISILHFDSMGIPALEEMIRQAGSIERWQERATHSWMEKIQREFKVQNVVILEGQSNLDFVTDGCAKCGFSEYTLILFDCEWETRVARLQERNQPELANPGMKNWSDFLRNQATRKGIRIIDTTHQSIEAATEELIALLPRSLT
jgi:cytidylate kinase